MTAAERAYLLACASLTLGAQRKAREAGETFHHVGGFALLSGEYPVNARAQWDLDANRLVLRLRFGGSPRPSNERLDRIAAIFFNGETFTALPVIELLSKHCFERAYFREATP